MTVPDLTGLTWPPTMGESSTKRRRRRVQPGKDNEEVNSQGDDFLVQDEEQGDDDDSKDEDGADLKMQGMVDQMDAEALINDTIEDNRKLPASNPVMLSKSWDVQKVHGPIFTGGTITLRSNYMLLPVGGDVVWVDSASGVPVTSVRGQYTLESSPADVDDDDDDGVDANAITSYAMSPTLPMIVTCSHNLLIRQYRVVDGETPENGEFGDSSVAIEEVKLWGRAGHSLPVTRMVFHVSGVFLATGSVDGSVRIWDVRGPHQTHHFRRPAGDFNRGGSGTRAITGLVWMDQSSELIIAIARDDGTIVIHNLRNERADEPFVTLGDHDAGVTSMAWSKDGTCFVSGGRDQVLTAWKVSTSETSYAQTKQKKGKTKKGTQSDASKLAFQYERLHTVPLYEDIHAFALLPTGRSDIVTALVAGSKGRLTSWQVCLSDGNARWNKVFEEEESRGETSGYTNLCTLSGDDVSNFRLLSADNDHTLVFWKLSQGLNPTQDRALIGHNDDILDVAFLPDQSSSQLVVATNRPQVRVFDHRDFSCRVLDGHRATVLSVSVSPCGRYIASAGKDKQVRLWGRTRAECEFACVGIGEGHTEAIGSVALSRQRGRYEVGGYAATNGGGSFCVTVSVDRTLKRWNISSDLLKSGASDPHQLVCSASARAHDKDINIVSVAPNDSYIGTGSQDKTIKIWKATNLSLVATLRGHKRGVWDVQFSPVDRVVATASGDSSIKLWSLSGTFSCVRTFQGHMASVLRVRFLTSGLQLVSSGADGLVKLWTIRTNLCEATMDRHRDKAWALDVSPQDNFMVSGGADSQLVVWYDTTEAEQAKKDAEAEEAILLDQKLANHIRRKEYKEALVLALQRDKPMNTLMILKSIIDEGLEQGASGDTTLRSYAVDWSEEDIYRLLRYCRDWNTRARNASVALLVVKAIVSTCAPGNLASIDGVPELLAGIVPYAERHFERLDRLLTSSYLLDFTLAAMGDLEELDRETQLKELSRWEANIKYVLPPKEVDGRTQVGGRTVVGRTDDSDTDEVVTLGDSETDDDNDSDMDDS